MIPAATVAAGAIGYEAIKNRTPFRYYGNYGGPGYSGGRFGSEANFTTQPVDSIDAAYRLHDLYYARGEEAEGDRVLLESLKSDNSLRSVLAGKFFALKSLMNHQPKLQRQMARVSPTNKSMHALNGNPPKRVVRLRTNYQPKQKNKLSRQRPVSVAPIRMGGATVSEAPVAFNSNMQNPVYFNVSTTAAHRDFGGTALRVVGRQSLLLVTGDATTGAFATSGGATINNVNWIYISPDNLGNRCAFMARWFSRYAFRKLRFTYIPYIAATTAGSLAMAYGTDGAMNTFLTTSFATIQDMVPSCLFVTREPCVLEMTYTGDNTWFTELDTATSAGTRSSVQGLLFGWPSAALGNATNHGAIYVEYIMDLYAPSSDYGFTVNIRNAYERDAVNKYLQQLRDHPDSTDQKDSDEKKE
jgi:hypothetical protein